jgi:hypothetical protein
MTSIGIVASSKLAQVTVASRGSGTPATAGTTWTTVTNAVDGAVGSNPATYAVFTNAVAAGTGTIDVSNYAFSSIPDTATIVSVNVSIRQLCGSPTSRWTSVQFQPFDGATAIGSPATATLSTTARNDAANFNTTTVAQLKSATFKIRVTAIHNGTTSSTFSLDHADVTVVYAP